MQEDERLSDLIGKIYDAALDPSLWVAVLPRCAQFGGGSAAALFANDAASKSGNVAYYSGIEPQYKQLYFEKIIKLDPLTIGHFFAEVEQPVAAADIIDYDEFLETRAYREWGQPQGIIDVLNVALDKTPTSAAMFCVFRHEHDGRVDDEMRRRMRIDTPSPPEVIAKTFKLTPSELRILLAVVEVGGVREVAEALGISETTVRFHLRQLFEKTGTHRQADLVKLVAGFANPLAPSPGLRCAIRERPCLLHSPPGRRFALSGLRLLQWFANPMVG